MWASPVVVIQPFSDLCLGILPAVKCVQIDTFILQAALQTLNEDVIAKATCCVIIQVMTYPLKLRQKVFATKKKFKLTFEQTSERFDIPIRTLFRWQKKIQPCLRRNKPATKLDMDRLAKDVQRAPDDYQWERAKRLNVSQRTIGYGLKRLGMTYKKNARTPQSE